MVEKELFDSSLVSYAIEKAKAAGASYADAMLCEETSFGYEIVQGAMRLAYQDSDLGIRIRMLHKGYMYSLSVENPTSESIAKLFRNMQKFKKQGNVGISDERESNRMHYIVKEKVEGSAEHLKNTALEMDKDIGRTKCIKSRYSSFNYSRAHTYFENTSNSRIECTVPQIGAFVNVAVSHAGNTRQRMVQKGAADGIDSLHRLRLVEDVVNDANNMEKLLETGINVNSQIKRIVLSPEIMGIATHESIGHPFEADRIIGREAAQAGLSYLTKDNLGMKIGSGAVNLHDDPTMVNLPGYYLYDDEGVKARDRILVKNGIQVNLFHNRETASLFGLESNGSARSSSVYVEPIVRMANTYLESDRSNRFDDLLDEAKNGAYVKNFMEWNIDDTRSFGKYQGNEAYIIENGRLGKPVKNFSIETRTTDFWGAVSMVDNEFEMFPGNCGKGEPMQGVPVGMGGPSALLIFR